MRYNNAVFNALKQYNRSVAAGLMLLVVIATGLVGYAYGYRNGAGDIATPPFSAHLTNTASSGDLSVVLDDPATKTDFSDFWKTWNILDKNFAPTSTSSSATSTSEERVAGAIAGLVASYNDPYTVFLPKENAASFKEQVNGEFEGIGAGLDITTADGVVIIGTLKGSPAEKAGLKPGDRIIAVDGEPTLGKLLEDVIPHIRGPKGTVVALTIAHPKSTSQQIVDVTRGNIVIPTTATRVVNGAKNVVAAVVAKATAAAAAALPGSPERKAAEQKVE
jgi:carboxyl-terminal processing protease